MFMPILRKMSRLPERVHPSERQAQLSLLADDIAVQDSQTPQRFVSKWRFGKMADSIRQKPQRRLCRGAE